MCEGLYFIPILAKALQQPDRKAALSDAFREISKRAARQQYAEGFKNFQLFMVAACSHHKTVEIDHVRELIVELVTETLEGTEEERRLLLKTIDSHPEWKAEYGAICEELIDEDLGQSSFPVIQVLGDTGLAGEVRFEKPAGCESIDGISPGDYSLILANNGWVIWAGRLTAKDLVWAEAYGAKDLDLAAETGDTHRRPTREIVLLDGDVILRTFPGIESGSIEVELAV